MLQLEHTAQHHHGIFQAGKGAAQFLQILVAVGGGVKLGQHHHAAGAKEGNGARCHDELLDLGRGTVQHGGLLICVSAQDPDGGRHRLPDKIPLAGIEIVDRTAAVCQLAQFGFRCHGGAPFQKRIPYKCTHRGGKCQCRRQKKKRQMSFIASANVIY